jgi:hypothetical protein
MRNAASFAALLVLAACSSTTTDAPPPSDAFVDTFSVAPTDWASHGRNPYFVLEPGYVLEFAGEEHDKDVRLVITVLDETKVVDGVETRVVEERESGDGELSEVSRNYYAFSKKDKGVYYFGEDVDEYEDGKVAKHGGSWRAGENGARFGLMMPGMPTVGMRWYQELAPGVAMDRSEALTLAEPVVVEGVTVNCLRTKETSGVEKGVEYKCYAPLIGLVRDGPCKLVRHGMKAGK